MSRPWIAVVVLVQCAILLAVALYVGDNGWDDGAITLAFSRTFAEHGRVALTPRSEVVEGFSSVSWFLLNALFALVRPSWRAAIAFSQALAVLAIGSTTLLLARTCALLRLDRLFSTLTVLAFAAWGCSFSEASNGMEMGLLAAACLVMINELLSERPRLPILCFGVALAVLTRFEALLYVGLLALSVFFVPKRRAFWAILLTAGITVALLSAWRLLTFSDVLPNTFWAKRWPPYAAFSLGDRLAGGVELAKFFVVPLSALLLAAATGFRLATALRARQRALVIVAAPVLGAVVMGVMTGRHWGYPGRMPYFAFPLVLAILARLFADWVDAVRSKTRLTVAFVAMVAMVAMAAAVAASRSGRPSSALAAAHQGDKAGFGASPRVYVQTGQVFRRLAAAAGVPQATILVSDVGGLALCCDEFRIVDLAFLCNRQLAHQGPTAIGKVLDAESPELIEAHWEWPVVGGLYDLPRFRTQYVPTFAGGTKLWIRRDLGEALARRGRGCWVPLQREDVQRAVAAHRYATTDLPVDRAAFARLGSVLALDEVEANGVNLCRARPPPASRVDDQPGQRSGGEGSAVGDAGATGR